MSRMSPRLLINSWNWTSVNQDREDIKGAKPDSGSRSVAFVRAVAFQRESHPCGMGQGQCRWLAWCERKGTFRGYVGTCLELPQVVDRIHFLMVAGFQLKATLSSERSPNFLPSGLPQQIHFIKRAKRISRVSMLARPVLVHYIVMAMTSSPLPSSIG